MAEKRYWVTYEHLLDIVTTFGESDRAKLAMDIMHNQRLEVENDG